MITLANMRKRNTISHALLNTSKAHILLLQEPWYDRISTTRCDDACEGIDVLGGVTSPAWDIHYPIAKPDQRPKVMAYVWKTINAKSNNPLPFLVISHPDICAHPCIQVLDIIHPRERWRILNFYHDIRDKSCLETLLALDLKVTTPTLIIGDFNTHSRSWSPKNIETSCWARKLEEWAVGNLLTLANNPGTIT